MCVYARVMRERERDSLANRRLKFLELHNYVNDIKF